MSDERSVTNAPSRPIRKAALRGAKIGAIAGAAFALAITAVGIGFVLFGVFILGWPAPPLDDPRVRESVMRAVVSFPVLIVILAAYGAVFGAGILAILAAVREFRDRRRRSP